MKKVMIVLGILILIGLTGCGKNEAEIAGKYLNLADPQEYIDLKSDGTVYVKERLFGFGLNETSGKWKTEDSELLLVGPLGIVERCKIKEDGSIIDDEGKIWTKLGKPKEITKKKTEKDREEREKEEIQALTLTPEKEIPEKETVLSKKTLETNTERLPEDLTKTTGCEGTVDGAITDW